MEDWDRMIFWLCAGLAEDWSGPIAKRELYPVVSDIVDACTKNPDYKEHELIGDGA